MKRDNLAAKTTQALNGIGRLPDVIATKRLVGAVDQEAQPQFEVTAQRLEAFTAAAAISPSEVAAE